MRLPFDKLRPNGSGKSPGVLSLLAEDAAEDVGYLADGGVGLDTLEDGGNGVAGTDGDGAEALKRGGGLGLIALVAYSLDALDLLADGLGVDALELLDGRRLGGELVHADDDSVSAPRSRAGA